MYHFNYETSSSAGATAIDAHDSLVARLSRCPREPDVLCYAARSASAVLCRAWLKMYHRLEIVGPENLPDEGPFVLLSNHTSHLDALCLLAALPIRRLHSTYP